MNDFVHLHVHTEYSMLDGNSRIKKLVSRASQHGMRALAITDHGSMHGALAFYDACKANNINPIQGVEAYLAPNMREKGEKRFEYNHLLLLAMDETGYRNLMKLVTLSHTEGFYQKPRIDKPTLAQYSDGLIVTSGCLAGEIPQHFLAGRIEEAYRAADWYLQVFGRERFYVEIQEHLAGGDQNIVNPYLIEMAKRLNLRMLATNDLHYVDRADAKVQDVMLCVQTGARLSDTDRMRFDGPEYYLKSGHEMAMAFSGLESALSNTVRVADMCHVDIEFNQNLLPQYATPNNEPQKDYLLRLVEAGMVEHYGLDWRSKTIAGVALADRMAYEFNIILSKGFVPYFLIVWDYVNYARRNGMRAVARGSVAGSIIAYALGISNVDPLHYGLLFERFLNPERNSMPDIDMDFPDDRREEVIRYVANKYGWDKVGQIATMIVMQAKTAVRDVGRVMGDYTTSDLISRLMGDGSHLETELANNQQLRDLYVQNHQASVIIDMARYLDGTVRADSVHAAGVVMANTPLVEITPCQHLKRERGIGFDGANGQPRWLVAQYEQSYLERLGILKFDFLGLSNLTILQTAIALVKRRYGDDIDIDRIPDNDERVFKMLSEGDTTGVFQLESPPMRAYIRELKPTSVHDIMAMVALYRPGPMDSIPRFIKAKHGLIPPTYPHPDVEDILRDSYGVIVYQDQVLLVAQRLAGLSWGELDKFRKAIGKKIMNGPDGVVAQKKKFIAGCERNGITKEKAEEIFSYIEPFAGYGFNRAHAAAYAWVAYQTAWMKVHYPAAFMAATLSKEAGDQAKVAHIIAECKRMHVDVLPPDINKSEADFTLEKRDGRWAVRFGLTAIKGLGERQCAGLLSERAARGRFRTLPEVFARVEGRAFTSAAVTAMIRAGAMVNLGERAALLACLEDAKKLGKKYRGTGDTTLFGDASPVLSFIPPSVEPSTQEQRLAWEKETMGVYVTGHPLMTHMLGEVLSLHADTRTSDVGADIRYKSVTLAGLVTDLTHRTTSRGENMATLTLEDLDGTVDVVAFPAVYAKAKLVLKKGNPIIVKGQVRPRQMGGESYQIVAEHISLYSREAEAMKAALTQRQAEALHISFVSQGGARDIALHKKLAEVLAQNPGDEAFVLYRTLPTGQKMRLSSSNGIGVTMSDATVKALNDVTPITLERSISCK